MDVRLRRDGPRGGAWREEVCVLELNGYLRWFKKILAQIVKYLTRFAMNIKGQCCYNI